MANITVLFGTLLILLGVGTFVLTGSEHVTALIPAFFGLPLGLLGVLARKERLRMHVMHAAVLLGLIGFAGAGYMVLSGGKLGDLFTTGQVIRDGKDRTVSTISQGFMALLCGIFTGLCVKSFIDVRRARKAAAAAPAGPAV